MTKDRTFLNIILWSVIAAALSLQLLIVIAFIFSFIPLKPSPLLQTMFLRHQALVLPEREMLFFRFFILMAAGVQAVGLWALRRRLAQAELGRTLMRFAVAETIWAAVLVFCVFKMFVYGNPVWAKVFFYAAVLASVLGKIFWQEISRAAENVRISVRVMDVAMPCLIALIIFVPDMTGLLAKMFVTDHFHHFDTMVTSAAWAHLKGGVLDVDQFTHYAVGLPVVLSHIAQVFGGFSYASVVWVLMIGSIAYYIAGYFFLRAWLESATVSAFAVLLAIKWQMFHPGVAPVIFNYPSATVLRYPLDIALFALIFAHIRRDKPVYLWSAAVVCGFSAFYMIDTGVYMAAAFFFYTGWVALRRNLTREALMTTAGYVAVTAASTLIFLGLVQGVYLFKPVFWTNLAERTALFLMGQGNLPMYKSLLEGKYLECFMGFFIPFVYVLTLITTVALIWFKKTAEKNILVAVLCVYGLGLYHYYILRSADTSYDVVVWPFVFILAFYLKALAETFHAHRRTILAGALGMVVFSLATNHYFLNYPNFLQLSRSPMTHPFVPMKLSDGSFFNHNDMPWPQELKLAANSLGETDEGLKTEADFKSDGEFRQYFLQEFDFSEDARLIVGLTGKDEQVPLISSFETRILMQADRRPFFYYFPLVDSRPMRMRMFDMTAIWTTGRLQKTMDQLQTARPRYIFMEKVLLATSVPAQYRFLYPDLLVMLNYIHQNYEPAGAGKYLVAMQRKDIHGNH